MYDNEDRLYNETYFICVHLLVCFISVNISQCTDMEYKKFSRDLVI